MIFNGNIISEEIFHLEADKLNRLGLYEYAMNLASHLGVEYAFAIQQDGTQLKTACYNPEENLVLIPVWAIDEELTEKEYRATKGLIDHETGHVFWQDRSYYYNLSDKSEENDKLSLIYLIGNIVDDIRVERRLVNEFNLDEGNFRHTAEVIYKHFQNVDLINNDILLLFFLVNVYYRNISYDEKTKVPLIACELFVNRIIPIIDRFIVYDEKAGETAKEIIGVWRADLAG